jgi:AraC-like DNA-binding protein
MVTGRPAPRLAPYVDGYSGYRLVGHPPGFHRGLPSRHLTFIVSLGEPIDVVAQTSADQRPDRYDFVIGGLQASTAVIAHHGHQEGIEVQLSPLGCRSLLGLPAGELWDRSLHGDEVLGRIARELRERVGAASTWADRFAACDVVLGQLVVDDPVPAGVRAAWTAVIGSGGSVPVADLAHGVGWSRRHLAESFRREIGCSPKLASRVVRFERTVALLRRPDRPGLAEVAAWAGYYDQPHLNRDFLALAGCSPTDWLGGESLPFVQDEPAGTGAPSVA